MDVIALAIIQLVVAGKPGGNFFGGKSINFGTPYYAITIGLNIVVSILIYVRLVYLISALNRKAEHEKSSKLHTGPAASFIESAALYSLSGIMFLVPYAAGSQTSIAFGQVWAKLTVSGNHIYRNPIQTDLSLSLTVYMSSVDYSQDGWWPRLEPAEGDGGREYNEWDVRCSAKRHRR